MSEDTTVQGTAVEELPDPEDFKPAGGELVARDPDDVFRAMDAHDERMVLEELQGRALSTMLYSFASGGEKKTGLSYWGVLEAVRTINARGFGRVRVSPDVVPQVDEIVEGDERKTRVTVYAEDAMTGGGQWGMATQPLLMKLRNGKQVPDPFAYVKALSKAQRNALNTLLPAEWREVLKAQLSGDEKRVREIKVGPGAEKLAELPPALTDKRAEKQRKQIRALYDELREANPLALLPAAFNQFLTQTQHDHDRMGDFIGHLEGLVAKEREESAA